jgi:hypothetical protein
MILPEIINPGGRPGPSEYRVYTPNGGQRLTMVYADGTKLPLTEKCSAAPILM